VTMMGSMIYLVDFAEAMRLVAGGLVRTRPLVTHRFALDEIGRAFAVHREPAAIKVAVIP
jgi:threonine dehydrogenase-like Zn-dependent dehydrogenase